MSEFHFLAGQGRLRAPAKIAEVCKRHGAEFTWARMPEGWRFWASAPNRGAPFDGNLAARVRADLEKEGLLVDGELRRMKR